MNINDCFPTIVSKDLFGLICGKKLGEGMSRIVYEARLNEDHVVKFEERGGFFQNVMEEHIWSRMRYVDTVSCWLAPVHAISPCGSFLVMQRTRPIRTEELPEMVPHWVTDEKPSNWGILNGKPVLHDYAVHLMLEQGTGKRMKKAQWSHGY